MYMAPGVRFSPLTSETVRGEVGSVAFVSDSPSSPSRVIQEPGDTWGCWSNGVTKGASKQCLVTYKQCGVVHW